MASLVFVVIGFKTWSTTFWTSLSCAIRYRLSYEIHCWVFGRILLLDRHKVLSTASMQCYWEWSQKFWNHHFRSADAGFFSMHLSFSQYLKNPSSLRNKRRIILLTFISNWHHVDSNGRVMHCFWSLITWSLRLNVRQLMRCILSVYIEELVSAKTSNCYVMAWPCRYDNCTLPLPCHINYIILPPVHICSSKMLNVIHMAMT